MAQSKLSIFEGATGHPDLVVVNWTIPNFKVLYNAAKADDKIRIAKKQFTVGGNDWTFYLERDNDNEESFNISLYFYGKRGSGKIGIILECSIFKLQEDGRLILPEDTPHFQLLLIVYGPYFKYVMGLSNKLKLLRDFVGSDVIFNCLEKGGSRVICQIKAHRAILSSCSSVFATMFGNEMQEAADIHVEIDDMSPNAMKILIDFIYSGKVDTEWGSVAAELFYGARKFDLKELQNYLCVNVYSVLTAQNVMNIKELAKLYNLPDVLESIAKFLDSGEGRCAYPVV